MEKLGQMTVIGPCESEFSVLVTFGGRCHSMAVQASVIEPLERHKEKSRGPAAKGGWIVTVFDNETNTYDEVIMVLMAATGCSLDEAEIETWEVDHLGKSVVHYSTEKECRRAAEIIATIGIQVEVSEE